MYIRQPALTITTLLLIITLSGFSTATKANEPDCSLQNDRLAILNLPQEELEVRLQKWITLSETCTDIPYVFHNTAVVYAKLNQWDNAASHFKKALEKQPQAQQSYQQLSSIYRYQAVMAYRNALHSNNPAPNKPSFTFQSSLVDDSKTLVMGQEKLTPELLQSTVTSIVENWIEQNRPNFADTEPQYLLVLDSSTPLAVIHTNQRSIILEFQNDQGLWQISKERSTP